MVINLFNCKSYCNKLNKLDSFSSEQEEAAKAIQKKASADAAEKLKAAQEADATVSVIVASYEFTLFSPILFIVPFLNFTCVLPKQ